MNTFIFIPPPEPLSVRPVRTTPVPQDPESQIYEFAPSICPSGRRLLKDGIPCLDLVCRNMKGSRGPTPFDLPKEVLDHISQVQKQYVLDRSRMTLPRTNKNGLEVIGNVPVLVFDLVVEYLEEREMRKVSDWTNLIEVNRRKGWAETLRAVSLVHRTLTPIAQRALHSSVTAENQAVEEFALSPTCGPWIKKLTISAASADPRVVHKPTQRYYGTLWSYILTRTFNLTALIFQTEFADETHFALFTKTIRELKNLEVLEVAERVRYRETKINYGHLSNFFVALSQLKKLKYLGLLYSTTYRADNERTALSRDLSKLTPPSTLKALYLQNYNVEEPFLKWLLEGRGSYQLETIIVSGSIGRLSLVKLAIPSVRELRLYSCEHHRQPDEVSFFTEIFPECYSLRKLCITTMLQLCEYTGALPASFEVLELWRDTWLWDRDSVDYTTAAEISLPEIIENTCNSGENENNKGTRHNLKKVVIHGGAKLVRYKNLGETCRRNGIVFEVVKKFQILDLPLHPMML